MRIIYTSRCRRPVRQLIVDPFVSVYVVYVVWPTDHREADKYTEAEAEAWRALLSAVPFSFLHNENENDCISLTITIGFQKTKLKRK